jgi:hypothetical protein
MDYDTEKWKIYLQRGQQGFGGQVVSVLRQRLALEKGGCSPEGKAGKQDTEQMKIVFGML